MLLNTWRERIEGVEFFAVNTDAQALRKTAAGHRSKSVAVSPRTGAGANQDGRNAADEIAMHGAALEGNMVFIAAGKGGGTVRCSTSRR